jgi:hypothetical protein
MTKGSGKSKSQKPPEKPAAKPTPEEGGIKAAPRAPKIPATFNPGVGSPGIVGDVAPRLPKDFKPEPGGSGVRPARAPED